MSTPKNKPFYSYLVSPYAPKWARDEAIRAEASLMTVDDHLDWKPREEREKNANQHDEKVFQDVENSLRDMVSAKHSGTPPKPVRLSEVSKIAEEQLARDKEQSKAIGTPGDLVIDGLRVPHSLMPRSLDPEPVPEPWPRPRAKGHNRVVPLLMRFGIATAGAAIIALIVVQDIPSLISEKFSNLISGASDTTGQVATSSMPARVAEVAKEQERAISEQQRAAFASASATANPAPAPAAAPPVMVPTPVAAPAPAPAPAAAPAQITIATAAPAVAPAPAPERPRNQVAAKGETPVPSAPEAKRETPNAPWPQIRSEPAIWLGPAGRAPTRESATTGSAPRPVPPEEVAMLRKQGDQFIAAGDFVGARAVLERAADAGDAASALALAATYDPVVLARFKVKGLTPDVVRASFWYERARDLGSPEAPRRLEAMMRGN